MKIVVTGGTGFIGQRVVEWFLNRQHQVTALASTAGAHPASGRSGFQMIRSDTTRAGDWQQAVADADVVINLAGRSIFKRWSRAYKQEMVASRIETTRQVVAAMPSGENRLLVSASAIGFYGAHRPEQALNESLPPGNDFLSDLSCQWEAAAREAENKKIRVVCARLGVVLAAGGGAMGQMLPAFRRFVGGPLGNGRQWFSWIHREDLVAAFQFFVDHSHLRGVFNMTAPHPVRNGDMARALARALNRPARIQTPSLLLRLALGEFANTLLASQRVLPERLRREGFEFQYPTIEAAFGQIVADPRR